MATSFFWKKPHCAWIFVAPWFSHISASQQFKKMHTYQRLSSTRIWICYFSFSFFSFLRNAHASFPQNTCQLWIGAWGAGALSPALPAAGGQQQHPPGQGASHPRAGAGHSAAHGAGAGLRTRQMHAQLCWAGGHFACKLFFNVFTS